MDATTTSEKVVRRAKALCQLPSTSTGVSFLGSDDTDAANELADLLNDAMRDVLDDCPIICVSEATLTAVSGSQFTLLPNDLRDTDILGLRWAGDGWHGRGTRLISRTESDLIPAYMRDSTFTEDPPSYCYLEWAHSAAALFWLGRPSIDRDFIVTYRKNPVVITATDVGPEGTNPSCPVVPIPDSIVELLIYKLAEKISERNNGGDGITWRTMADRYEQLKTKAATKLASTSYERRMSAAKFNGLPGRFVESTQASELNSSYYYPFGGRY